MSTTVTSAQEPETAVHTTEVLAPAGCFSSLTAAIQAGANAVYFGLAQLNMRAKARRTFEMDDLSEIMTRLHDAKVKGYLAINTVMYDHDLTLVAKMLDEAKRCEVDAVIVADMSVVMMARELGLECHLSTQLSVSNYPAFKFYAQFCDRIVLARELNLAMIKKIHQKIVADDLRGPHGRLMEIEAFAHGALCVATSGRCSMSLFTDNASANRGACRQNCRKTYKVIDEETGQALKIDNNFIMSPDDIATIDFLDELLAAGIHTLKIEGRGRSPEYVLTVVRAYRRAVEAVAAGSYSEEFVNGLYEELKEVYNRGLSSGYYLGRPQGWSGVYGSQATKQKIEIGKVTNFYTKLGVAEISATRGGLAVGDEYTIIGPTTGVIEGKVEEMRLDGESTIESIEAGQVFSIKTDQRVRRSDTLYAMREVKPKK
ncbi:MAG: U32 family peptidase [Pirellulales bacterium]